LISLIVRLRTLISIEENHVARDQPFQAYSRSVSVNILPGGKHIDATYWHRWKFFGLLDHHVMRGLKSHHGFARE